MENGGNIYVKEKLKWKVKCDIGKKNKNLHIPVFFTDLSTHAEVNCSEQTAVVRRYYLSNQSINQSIKKSKYQ